MNIIFIVLAAFFSCLWTVLVKKIHNYNIFSSTTTVFSTISIAAIIVLVFSIINRQPHEGNVFSISKKQIIVIAVSGIILSGFYIFYALTLKNSELSELMIYYTPASLIIGIVMGFLFFGETDGLITKLFQVILAFGAMFLPNILEFFCKHFEKIPK